MPRPLFAALFAALLTGCGGSGPTEIKLKELTAEEKARLAAQDRSLDDEEKSGAGTATKKGRTR